MHFPRFLAGRVGDLLFATVGILLVLGSLILAFAYHEVGATPERSDEVAAFVHDFGEEIGSVSLTGPRAEAVSAMQTLYAPFVSPSLLTVWEEDISRAPGRNAAHPHPTGIRVSSVQNVGVGTYVVKGYVTEETKIGTTTDQADGQGIIIGVIRLGNSWQIVEYQLRTGN